MGRLWRRRRHPCLLRGLRDRWQDRCGHDRRCPPEGPDGVQVKCKNRLKLGGNSLIITNNFGPGFKRKTTATDPHFTNSHQASCNIPNGWEQTSAVWQMLTMSPADSLFSKFKSVRSWSGGSDPRSIMITVTELQNNSAPTPKKRHPRPF